MSEKIEHPWEAVYDKESKILILGTMPSPKSRENGFYYGHPQNIFWKTLASVLGEIEPKNTPEARRIFLLSQHIAVWDVIQNCEIQGAADDSITNAEVNDFTHILAETQIKTIFTTGKTAYHLYQKFCVGQTGIEAIYLPSTSPANRAGQGKADYMERWKRVRECLLSMS